MKHFVAISTIGLALAVAQQATAADTVSKDVAARVEAIPIQTLTISDEQFLKGDAYGRPTTIAGVLREHWRTAASMRPHRIFWQTPVSWLKSGTAPGVAASLTTSPLAASSSDTLPDPHR